MIPEPDFIGSELNMDALSEADWLLRESLKSVHNHGASLFNKGLHAEAFQLYQGALFVTLQLLSDRPELKLLVAEGLSDVERSVASEQLKAFRLHEVT